MAHASNCPSARRRPYRTSGAAEKSSAAPIGYGWNGSFDAGYNPAAAVLVDCAPLPGKASSSWPTYPRTSGNSRTSR